MWGWRKDQLSCFVRWKQKICGGPRMQTKFLDSIYISLMRRVFTLFCLITIAAFESFDSFVKEMEKKVRRMGDSLSQAYEDRCIDFYSSCQVSSYLECEGTSLKQCFWDMPRHLDCLGPGVLMGKEPGIILPPHKSKEKIDGIDVQFICATASIHYIYLDLDDGRNQRYGISYIGSSTGLLKRYPSLPATCDDYDPRFRPWYVAAASGRKNVLIMADTSQSMKKGNPKRIKLARQAVKSVINTLSNSDTFGLISFNSVAKGVRYNGIVRATDRNKQRVIDQFESISPSGISDYYKAFNKAFSMLDAANDDQFGAIVCPNAENVFLFLSDGIPNSSFDDDELYELIDSKNAEHNHTIKLFTYALGTDVNLTLLKDMSCRYNGISFDLPESTEDSQLAETMSGYYVYLAQGVQINDPIWTEPYDDAFGFGRMITVAYPIFLKDPDNPAAKLFIGVAGIDVTMQSLERFSLSENKIVQTLLEEFPCQNNILTECDLEELRPEESKCEIEEECSESNIIDRDCEGDFTRDIFEESVDHEERICCGLTIVEFIIIMVIVGAIVIAGIITGICCYRKHKKPPPEQNLAAKDPDLSPYKPKPDNVSSQSESGKVKSKENLYPQGSNQRMELQMNC